MHRYSGFPPDALTSGAESQNRKQTMKTDWTAIENEYVTGTASYQDIADAKGISLTSIKEHGRQGGWYRKRQEHRKDCTTRTAEKTAETVADQMAALQELQLQSAVMLAERLERQITEATHLKSSEMLQYARVLAVLHDFIQGEKPAEAENIHGYVCFLPERTAIDEPPDTQ